MIKTSAIPYRDQQVELEGFAAFPSSKEKLPLVILCHAWKGRDDFICEKATEIAKWGYAGFALDMYGKGIIGRSKEENAALKKPFIDDRQLLLRRVVKGFETAASLSSVDPQRVAVIGLGFGGICALDLARSGANLKGAVSIYGHFFPPPIHKKAPIKAKILALQGSDDPFVSQEELKAFEEEMNDAGVDWQLHIFGKTMHAFATPSANDPASGILYNPLSAKRTWQMVRAFLEEVL
jgi:dienelactone hydrolase